MNNIKIFIFVLCLIGALVYAGSLGNNFVFDDKALVEHNPFIKSVKLLPGIFKMGIYDHCAGAGLFDRMYRPLQVISYWFDYRIWGLRPFGFRLTNILLHLANSVLLFYLYYRISLCYKVMKNTRSAIDYGLKSFNVNPYFKPNLISLGDLYAEIN